MNCQEKEGRTPLLIGASNQAWGTVKLLLEKEADIMLTDNKNRNFLHLSILNGAKIQDMGSELFQVRVPIMGEMSERARERERERESERERQRQTKRERERERERVERKKEKE